jgi:hypothetical protein
MHEHPDANRTVPLPPDNPSRRGFLLKTLSAFGAAILAVFGRKDRIAASAVYDPPKAYRVFLPQLMRDGKDPNSDKNPSEKNPTSDKDPNEKTPGEKDPNEKTPNEKDPNEKDPISDKDPSEKDPTSDKDPSEKPGEGVPDWPSSPSRGHLFDEWGPR